MKCIVGIGANVCDTLITVPHYPEEDTKLGAASISQCGGGPCATGLAAAARLGADCAYIGVLTDDSAGKFLMEDLQKYEVSTALVETVPGHTSFSSYVWLSEESATRTCVFHRGTLPPLSLSAAQKEAICKADILMIDGNELPAALAAVKLARENGTRVLYDAGGLYAGVEDLLPYVDILIPSEEYALGMTGAVSAEAAAQKLYASFAPEIVVITQGKKGGILYDGKEIMSYPAFPVEAVDTNGSGDVFHGAFAYALTKGQGFFDAAVFSSAVSAIKCTKIGARAAVPTRKEVLKFLKERGYDEFKEDLDEEMGKK
ncbi:MAG: hypothetical protein E7408_03325 [Ruminococcaceae bacterium]|nr:hypothetical protein [Oscillospiraceae bacterium]